MKTIRGEANLGGAAARVSFRCHIRVLRRSPSTLPANMRDDKPLKRFQLFRRRQPHPAESGGVNEKVRKNSVSHRSNFSYFQKSLTLAREL